MGSPVLKVVMFSDLNRDAMVAELWRDDSDIWGEITVDRDRGRFCLTVFGGDNATAETVDLAETLLALLEGQQKLMEYVLFELQAAHKDPDD
jgi:hypothetical protein